VTTTQQLIVSERVREESKHPAPTVSPDASALMKIIDRAAMDPSFDVAKLEQLLAVKERWEANEARKAFVGALAEFKANPPELIKNQHVKFSNKAGGVTEYHHATLDQVSVHIGKALSEHGLSHRWDVKQVDGGMIRVTCVLTHCLGHSESVSMEASRDDSGSKNNIQALGSAVTYLQRYTLLAATGMAVKGQDNDGAGADDSGMSEGVLADHLAAIDAAADRPALVKAFGEAWKAAEALNDTKAMKKLGDRKEERKKAMGVKS
jgi:hypothetical protein